MASEWVNGRSACAGRCQRVDVELRWTQAPEERLPIVGDTLRPVASGRDAQVRVDRERRIVWARPGVPEIAVLDREIGAERCRRRVGRARQVDGSLERLLCLSGTAAVGDRQKWASLPAGSRHDDRVRVDGLDTTTDCGAVDRGIDPIDLVAELVGIAARLGRQRRQGAQRRVSAERLERIVRRPVDGRQPIGRLLHHLAVSQRGGCIRCDPHDHECQYDGHHEDHGQNRSSIVMRVAHQVTTSRSMSMLDPFAPCCRRSGCPGDGIASQT